MMQVKCVPWVPIQQFLIFKKINCAEKYCGKNHNTHHSSGVVRVAKGLGRYPWSV